MHTCTRASTRSEVVFPCYQVRSLLFLCFIPTRHEGKWTVLLQMEKDETNVNMSRISIIRTATRHAQAQCMCVPSILGIMSLKEATYPVSLKIRPNLKISPSMIFSGCL